MLNWQAMMVLRSMTDVGCTKDQVTDAALRILSVLQERREMRERVQLCAHIHDVFFNKPVPQVVNENILRDDMKQEKTADLVKALREAVTKTPKK